ncbi:MAG: OmpA family protein [Cytophagales bacterium]|uniref:OmpA/MotB family protein n=1 Tax=Cyclobacterium marinum TaxID=104 RepID=UPI0011EC48B2|nr:flagellar motor protein MotB [Cyclobacterium marinum]MBI0400826.1 OmpA family protein [Cyclobacterium marinum]MBR9774977.1 OmpA family protein [Cytophagales bacterium]|tara:strand:+ start:36301 stop:37137 length:837 start_codon:yes stop_codon:yes gene_type:complete
MWNKIIFRSIVLIIPLWYACVPQKKYNEVNIRNAEMMRSLRTTENKLDSTNNSLETFIKKADKLEEDLEASNRKNEALEAKLERAIATSSSVQQELTAKEQRMMEQQERLDLLQNLLDEQRAVMEGLKTTIDKALVQYRSDELQVFEQDGKLYVSLQDKLLFPSGSATVNKDGKEALSKLAAVINNSPDIQILVEGHTDNVPIRGRFEDNWALSTARATAIVRVLTNAYDVQPERVTAAGRSFYYPKASNETPEGRAKNRRTEIILTPQLNELFQLLR